jgi:hypothetical protein
MHRGRYGNYVDDWIGYGDDLQILFDDFQRFLEVCDKYQITLGISKTKFGYKEARFFGFRVNNQGRVAPGAQASRPFTEFGPTH